MVNQWRCDPAPFRSAVDTTVERVGRAAVWFLIILSMAYSVFYAVFEWGWREAIIVGVVIVSGIALSGIATRRKRASPMREPLADTPSRRAKRIASARTMKWRIRPCCGDKGKRHRLLDRRRYAYHAISKSSGLHVMRKERKFSDSGETQDSGVLCPGGHWTRASIAYGWVFKSERAADDMARHLNAGLPVFRDRWSAMGSAVCVTCAIIQAANSFRP